MNKSARARLLAICTTLVLAVLGLVAPAAAIDLPAAPVATDEAGALSLDLLQVTPTVARPGDTLFVSVQVTNDSTEPRSDLIVHLGVGWRRFLNRHSLADWANAPVTETVNTKQFAEVPPLLPGESAVVELLLPVDELALGNDFGPRAMSLSLTDLDQAFLRTIHTFLIWDPTPEGSAPRPPVPLSILLPVTGPAIIPVDVPDGVLPDDEAGENATVQELRQLVGPDGRLQSVLAATNIMAATTGAPDDITLAIDPGLLELASSSPDQMISGWAQALGTAASTTDARALPAFDPDLAALTHALDLSTAQRYQMLNGPSTHVPEGWAGPLAWLPDSAVPDLPTLETAVDAGFDTVVATTGLAPQEVITPNALVSIPTNSGTVQVIVPDPVFSREFIAPESAASAIQRLLADAAVIETNAQALGGADGVQPPHLAVALPRNWSPDLEEFTLLVRGLVTSGMVDFAPLSELLEQPPSTTRREPLAPAAVAVGELPNESVVALAAFGEKVNTLAHASDYPADIVRLAAPALAAPLSVAWRAVALSAGEPTRAIAVDQAVVMAQEPIHRVAAGSQDTTLVSAVGRVPISVSNDLNVPVEVYVQLEPEGGSLLVEDMPLIWLAANSSELIYIPVNSLASGDVNVRVDFLTPSGELIGEATQFVLRVRLGISNFGNAFVGIAIVGLSTMLLVGIWRTVQRGTNPNRVPGSASLDPPIFEPSNL